MTSGRLFNMNIKVLYLSKNFYASPKQISGDASAIFRHLGLVIGIRTTVIAPQAPLKSRQLALNKLEYYHYKPT